MAKLQALDAKTVATRPPWERDEFHYKEVPAFLKHEYGFYVVHETVHRWIRKGAKRATDGKAIWLKSFRKARRVFVRKADLIEFINQL
jgi:hypothetical protein